MAIPCEDLIDHVEEDVLNSEEARINRSNKVTHTVYNAMPFPDPLDRTVRTITATCTRVSRESIVIATGSERRSEEHTSELQSLMRISYAVFCLKKKKNIKITNIKPINLQPNK